MNKLRDDEIMDKVVSEIKAELNEGVSERPIETHRVRETQPVVIYYYYDEEGYRKIITYGNLSSLKLKGSMPDCTKKILKSHPKVQDHCFVQMDGKEFKINLDGKEFEVNLDQI
ncbi:hypothetical protein ACWEWU_10825 [Staphylococcus xylosus]